MSERESWENFGTILYFKIEHLIWKKIPIFAIWKTRLFSKKTRSWIKNRGLNLRIYMLNWRFSPYIRKFEPWFFCECANRPRERASGHYVKFYFSKLFLSLKWQLMKMTVDDSCCCVAVSFCFLYAITLSLPSCCCTKTARMLFDWHLLEFQTGSHIFDLLLELIWRY